MEALPDKNNQDTGQDEYPGLLLEGKEFRMLYFAC